jgi:hypothetical protein
LDVGSGHVDLGIEPFVILSVFLGRPESVETSRAAFFVEVEHFSDDFHRSWFFWSALFLPPLIPPNSSLLPPPSSLNIPK